VLALGLGEPLRGRLEVAPEPDALLEEGPDARLHAVRERELPRVLDGGAPPEPRPERVDLVLELEQLAEEPRPVHARRLLVVAEPVPDRRDRAALREQRLGHREVLGPGREVRELAAEPLLPRLRLGERVLGPPPRLGRPLRQEHRALDLLQHREDPVPLRDAPERLLRARQPPHLRVEVGELLRDGRGARLLSGELGLPLLPRLHRVGQVLRLLLRALVPLQRDDELLLVLPAGREDLLRLRVELLQHRVDAAAPEPGREQALAEIAAPLEQGLAAAHEPLVGEAEHDRVLVLRQAAEQRLEPRLVHGLLGPVEQRVLVALAPDELQGPPVLGLEVRADAELLVITIVRVLGLLRYLEQEPEHRPERRALAHGVRAQDDVQRPRPRREIEREVGERAVPHQIEREDLHVASSPEESCGKR
jgi:hypothetical protein